MTARFRAALIVLAVVALALGLFPFGFWGCSSPTAPVLDIPLAFTGIPVSDSQKAAALAEWDYQAECVGYHKPVREALRVEARQGFFACGTIAVNGCTFQKAIQVNVQVYVPAVSHELIHWMLMDMGRDPDAAHKGEVWPRCDHLNWKRATGGIDYGID